MQTLLMLVTFGFNSKSSVLLTIAREYYTTGLLQDEARWIDEGFSEFHHLQSSATAQL